MFNKELFPTPKWLVQKMIAPFDLSDAYVLDPSAGTGNILDVIAEKYNDGHRYHKANLYAVEIEPELRAILASKGYPIVGEDFLEYTPTLHFTHVIANPPFSQGVEHLLYAWRMIYEGEIVCLLPLTSLEGKYADERVLLALIEDHGTFEPVGQAFKNAERPTDVEVAIVRLTKKGTGDRFDFDVANDNSVDADFSDAQNNELALNGFVENLLASFQAAVGNYEEYVKARMKIERYTAPFERAHYTSDHNIITEADGKQTPHERHNTFVSGLQERAWNSILDHPRFQAILTSRARDMLAEFRARQKRVDFNEKNIRAMFGELVAKKDDLLMAAVLDVFDNMTEYHEENRIHVEGWKSDKAWMVNRRVVLPYYVEYGWGGFHINYHRRDKLNDIDRAMCVVANLPYDDICRIETALEASFQRKGERKCESEFFSPIRYFQKGTIHLTFKDEALWKKFNQIAAMGRGWLPPGQ
jgi:hypothetical protein